MDIYAQNILDRYKNPFHKDKKIHETISHKEANHSCGDIVTVKLSEDGMKIIDYSYAGNGCAISMAASDMIGDLIINMTTDQILELSKDDLFELLGIEISLRRSKCALLSLLALQNGILISLDKPTRNWTYYHLS